MQFFRMLLGTSVEDLTHQTKCLKFFEEELKKNANNEFIKDQYKLIIDSSHKIGERAKDSNLVYITANSIFVPFLIKFYDLKSADVSNIIIFTCLIGTGMLICHNWLTVMKAYRKVNYSNYLIIKVFEQFLPTSVFSLRVRLSDPASEKGNFVSHREKIIPNIFIVMYITIYAIFLYDVIFRYLNE